MEHEPTPGTRGKGESRGFAPDEAEVEIIPGTLEMLLLRALAGGSMHGFGLARTIETLTRRRLTIDEGALYPALHRMEKRGLVTAEWKTTANRRRAKYYRITDAGADELAVRKRRWEASSWAVDQVLESEG